MLHHDGGRRSKSFIPIFELQKQTEQEHLWQNSTNFFSATVTVIEAATWKGGRHRRVEMMAVC